MTFSKPAQLKTGWIGKFHIPVSRLFAEGKKSVEPRELT